MTDAEPATSAPLRFRKPELVVALLGYVYDSEVAQVSWLELVEVFTSGGRPVKTIENTIYELVAFGALHRIGQAGNQYRGDTRALKPTDLGRAWLDGEILALPTDTDRDALDEAERIALELEETVDLELPVHHLEPGSEL